MSYAETLEFLYAQLPMFHRIGPAAFKKDLTNTLALTEHLGNPHCQFRSIHIGGTNGKGSVSHMLAAICQAAGLKTGLYISPHYRDFRERIKINGQYIPKKSVVDFVTNNRSVIESVQPSFFELCVAMAFDHFARERVDIAVIEVGLGGRLDSTNIIHPLFSVVTNISYDHQNMLGDTLPLIAGEKAGIIKPETPVVIGESHPESAPVFVAKAKAERAPIVFADQHILAVERSSNVTTTTYDVFKNGALFLAGLELNSGGPYQAKNLVTLLQAWEQLRVLEPRVDEAALRNGLRNLKQYTRFIGRWEIIGQHPTVLIDSAHNEAGLRTAFEKIRTIPFQRLHIVTGFVNDKSVEKVLPYYPTEARYYFAKANIPRGLDAKELKEKARPFGLNGRAYVSVRQALKAALRAAQPDDLVVVIGSIFVVAEVVPS
ncbi:MAG: bifunctional folylpolyglutamate synthase/dihydrofolate synthase [Saprospiraceae bacterium]|nr:bifunctional folylpolyglutamate synthase/dihydrofolate synthase [Saprospiraceae bacterium]